MWRSGCRPNISVAAPFVWRCLTGSTVALFPHPAHRTGRADFRIRLLDKTSRLRPRLAAPTRGQAYETVMPVRPGTAQIYTVPCSMSAQFPAFQATGLGFCFMKLGIIGSTSTALSVTILAGAELVRERSVTIIIFMGRAGSTLER